MDCGLQVLISHATFQVSGRTRRSPGAPQLDNTTSVILMAILKLKQKWLNLQDNIRFICQAVLIVERYLNIFEMSLMPALNFIRNGLTIFIFLLNVWHDGFMPWNFNYLMDSFQISRMHNIVWLPVWISWLQPINN